MRNRGKTGWKIAGTLLLLLLIGGVVTYGWMSNLHNVNRPTNDITQPEQSDPNPSENRTEEPPETPNPEKETLSPPPIDKSLKRPLSFLVVGIDERERDSGRTDTIIVFTANPDTRTIKMISIPRDTKTELSDVHEEVFDKINHAYSRGKGIQSTKKTIEHFLGIPIDYTASVNMKGFEQLVDTFGGVDVNVPRDFSIKGHHYRKGPMTLNGEAALYYVRERTSSNDFDRNIRQQQVLRSLIDKSVRFATVTKIRDILKIIGENVKTNLTPLQLFQLQRLYGKVQDDDIEQLELTGDDEWSDAYYFIVDEKSKEQAVETLRAHLELEQAEATFY